MKGRLVLRDVGVEDYEEAYALDFLGNRRKERLAVAYSSLDGYSVIIKGFSQVGVSSFREAYYVLRGEAKEFSKGEIPLEDLLKEYVPN